MHQPIDLGQIRNLPDETLRETMARLERTVLNRSLTKNQGIQARAARDLGMTREGLAKKLKRLGMR